MTIEEAIKHAEEVAEKNERRAESVRNRPISSADFYHEEESCSKCATEHRQLATWLKELKAHRESWEKCIKEIKEWYFNADKQSIAKDPCVVDAMVDLFIRTIKECRPKEGDNNAKE